ncbi:DNA polymerase III, delta subunit [Gloeothece citriformis PCC 7424]|uniref:DNA polymerase III subunit delta n=1 Tax=Gloeothece citriformis (strain PCC 7424) TaxID=65393 RepID=B7KFD6_GLOC7|nr:DNA polymerase III subunit delta [Gloeothece citriformis]ACK71852.1 DNA polymerase III, delta subunit [Gloeothece citriformis PCC 7424]
MPVYLFWGEDDFAMTQEIEKLRQDLLDPNWVQFNYDKLTGDKADSIIEALNQAMTPVFGMGNRLVWLVETTICSQCSEALLSELQRTLPHIPTDSHLLLTTSKKPDKRLKSTKLIEQYAKSQEFALIPPWKTDEILQKVQSLARSKGVKLTATAVELLAQSVGNNTRQLWNELDKLSLYGDHKPIDHDVVASLVNVNTQSSLQLAAAIIKGETPKALGLVADLLNHNEPALKIVATLVGQFRVWTIVKLKLEAGEKDEKALATAAELGNPKRVFILRKEVQGLKGSQLLGSLPILLDLEFNLKRGADPLQTLQTKIVELCRLFA